MCKLISRFCRDERGTLLLTEWVFLATILVIAIIPLTFSIRNRCSEAPVTSVIGARPISASLQTSVSNR